MRLQVTALRSEFEVSQVLAARADPSILNKEGRSALHLASRARKPGAVYLLTSKLGKEAINLQDSSGRSALHDACASGQPESVYCLLKAGANMHCKDFQNRTPLHACAEYPVEEALYFLQSNSRSIAGYSTDQYRPAGTSNHQNWYQKQSYQSNPSLSDQDSSRIGCIVDNLLAAGADVNSLDAKGQTPLDLALRSDCREMISAIRNAHPGIKCEQLEAANPKLEIELALRKVPR